MPPLCLQTVVTQQTQNENMDCGAPVPDLFNYMGRVVSTACPVNAMGIEPLSPPDAATSDLGLVCTAPVEVYIDGTAYYLVSNDMTNLGLVSSSQQSCTGNEMANPPALPLRTLPSIPCYNGVAELEVKETRVTIPDQYGGEYLSFTTRLYHWQGTPMLPAPTIRMMPNMTCEIRVTNSLPPMNPAENCTSNHVMDMMHCADVVNVSGPVKPAVVEL